MRYYKVIKNGYIKGIGTGLDGIEITGGEYDIIMSAILAKPEDTESTGYRLRTDLTWESYEKEPQPEPDLEPEEIVDIIFGGAS